MALGPCRSARTSPGIPRWRCRRRSVPYHALWWVWSISGVGCMAAWASMAAPGRPHGPLGPLGAVGCDNGPWQGPAPLQRRAGGPVRRQSTSRAVAWHWVRGTGELPAALYNGWAVTTGRYRSRDGAPRRRRHTRHATGRATGAVCRAAVGNVALWVPGGRAAAVGT